MYSARPIRAWSDHGPKNEWVRSPTTEVILHAEQAHFLENYNISRSDYHSKIHNSSAPACHEIWMGNLNATLSNISPGTETGSCSFALFFFDSTSLRPY